MRFSVKMSLLACLFCSFVILSLYALSCNSAIPPGYQDEIFCPPNTCLKAKRMPVGWSGPQVAFRECCNIVVGSMSMPKAWGFKIDRKIKDNLLIAGWHSTECYDVIGQLALSCLAISDYASSHTSAKFNLWLYQVKY